MYWRSAVGWAIATISFVTATPQAAESAVYQDPLTGFTFSQYMGEYTTNGKTIAFRIALPSDATAGQPYDVVLQIAAPKEVGWAGLAWDSHMTGCPLVIAWANGQSVTITSRWATSHTLPAPYDGSSYEILPTGTSSNGTHWQFTAKCSGCTQSGTKILNPKGTNTLAFAYSAQGPANPASNTSTFPAHSVQHTWDHDFAQGSNPSFSELVVQNGGKA